jgi:LmbE family N-acetylglucosaminyl deacetylase
MNINKALIIAAHPDDDILGCGGIISKLSPNTQFKVVFIAEGSTCRFNNPKCSEALNALNKRNKHALMALEFLKVKNYSFYNLPCGKLDQVSQLEINKIIESEIKSFSPDTVFTHSNCDSNKDHHKVYDATIIATRPGSGVKNVLSYEVLSSTEWGFDKVFTPNIFYPLSQKDINNKWEALKFYETEIKKFPYPRSKRGIQSLASYRGMQSGNEYAEAYKLIRGVT